MFNPFASTQRMAALAFLLVGGWWTFWAPLPPTSPESSAAKPDSSNPTAQASKESDVADDASAPEPDAWDKANSFRRWARSTLAKFTGETTLGEPEDQQRWRPALRIGSLNITKLTREKYKKPNVTRLLMDMGQQCDLIALQGLQPQEEEILLEWSESLTPYGLHFDYLVGPIVGRGNDTQRFAFLFNSRKIETDRKALYTVQDPQDLIAFDPLVAWFRVRGIDPTRAFTFSLANLQLNEPSVGNEQAILRELTKSLRNDGRQEDDIILIGSIECLAEQLPLHQEGWVGALTKTATDPSRQRFRDNIILHPVATEEYQMKAEVFDFLRAYNLTLEEALGISQHMPLWGEFAAVEGGFQ